MQAPRIPIEKMNESASILSKSASCILLGPSSKPHNLDIKEVDSGVELGGIVLVGPLGLKRKAQALSSGDVNETISSKTRNRNLKVAARNKGKEDANIVSHVESIPDAAEDFELEP
ncbi:hypothetical protein ACFE04_029523 [Oxalis oulophora]